MKRRNARTRQRAEVAEEAAPEPEPVLVDGVPLAAPVTVVDRLYQDRRPSSTRLHAVMSNGRAPCGSNRLVLDLEHRRPVSELVGLHRCRSVACRRVFALADEAVAHG